MKSLAKLLSTLFYVGTLPRFHATAASIIGFAIYQALFTLTQNHFYSLTLYFVPLLLGLIAVYLYLKTADVSHDPKEVVLDEFFAAALIPYFFYSNISLGITVLLLYRVIDIQKPGFLKKIDGWNSWIAIYLDDFAAVLIAIGFAKAIEFLTAGI